MARSRWVSFPVVREKIAGLPGRGFLGSCEEIDQSLGHGSTHGGVHRFHRDNDGRRAGVLEHRDGATSCYETELSGDSSSQVLAGFRVTVGGREVENTGFFGLYVRERNDEINASPIGSQRTHLFGG